MISSTCGMISISRVFLTHRCTSLPKRKTGSFSLSTATISESWQRKAAKPALSFSPIIYMMSILTRNLPLFSQKVLLTLATENLPRYPAKQRYNLFPDGKSDEVYAVVGFIGYAET